MFRPGWRLTVFVGVFLPLFVTLGVWQLNRADQKAQLVARIEAGQSSVQSLGRQSEPLPYQRYAVSGRLLTDRVWLLDNRTLEGRVGYEVWVPLVTDHGWYLVSLGWVAGTGDRQRLPGVELPDSERRWIGQWRPLSDTIVLGQTPLVDHWPQVVQRIQPEVMAERMQQPEPRGLLQLEAGQPGVGPVIWTPTVMSPERHQGYAVQWFAMAVVLLMMYGYAGWRRSDRGSTPTTGENE